MFSASIASTGDKADYLFQSDEALLEFGINENDLEKFRLRHAKLKKIKNFIYSVAANTPESFNYPDGLCGIVTGIQQLSDEENCHQTQNKIKGALNIVSGVQLLLFSYMPFLQFGATTFAGPAFALAMLADIINASI